MLPFLTLDFLSFFPVYVFALSHFLHLNTHWLLFNFSVSPLLRLWKLLWFYFLPFLLLFPKSPKRSFLNLLGDTRMLPLLPYLGQSLKHMCSLRNGMGGDSSPHAYSVCFRSGLSAYCNLHCSLQWLFLSFCLLGSRCYWLPSKVWQVIHCFLCAVNCSVALLVNLLGRGFSVTQSHWCCEVKFIFSGTSA